MTDYPYPPFPEQEQDLPGSFRRMDPVPDHGEDSWKGNGRLTGRVALITGADSGIGRAVAIAYAREGADLALVCLDEKGDMEDTAALVRQAGRECLVIMTDLSKAENCRDVIAQTVDRFGRIDILVNNAAHQRSFAKIEDISDEEWRYTFATNIDAMFYLTKAAVAHMGRGGRDHQHRVGECRQAQPGPAGLCHDQGRDPELHRGPCADAGRSRHPRECRGAGAGLDAADPGQLSGRQGRHLRPELSHRAAGAACGTGIGLCDAGGGGLQLHLRGDHRGHRRPADHLRGMP